MSPTFAELGVPSALVDALSLRGITEPFPIQAATLADALAGRDVCGKAPTGSGKTIAFGLPLAARVTNAAPKRPKALVLVPTRELAAQVRDELAPLLRAMGRSVHAFYGGVGFGPQLTALRRGVDVVVACPGRLADLVQRGDVRLDRVTFVVVDEADRMADMGFLPEVRRLLDQVHPDRQTLLFSATLDGAVGTLVERYQRNPVRHGVERDEDLPVNRHVLWQAERDERVGLTAEVVSKHWPAIVFSRTKHGADRLVRQLGKLGVAAEAIHGNRSQGQRERALRNFTGGRAQALVATDVAARGIHVDGVACVVHFDAPPDPKDFVHRSGRTGRAGAEGLVVTLTPAADARTVTKMMRQAGVVAEPSTPDVVGLGRGTAPVGRMVPVPSEPEPAEASRGRGSRGGPGQGRGRGRQGGRSGEHRSDGDRPGADGGSGSGRRPTSEGGPKGSNPRRRARKGSRGGPDRLGLDGQPARGDRSTSAGGGNGPGRGRPGGRSGGKPAVGGRPGGGSSGGGRSGSGGRSGGGSSRSGGGSRSGRR